MAKVKETGSKPTIKRKRPALSPDARENQMISYAVDLAEQQLLEGTASSQVITHYLKLGSSLAKLEKERLVEENKLLKAKTEQLQSAKKMEVLYEQAIKAMQNYSGNGDPDEY